MLISRINPAIRKEEREQNNWVTVSFEQILKIQKKERKKRDYRLYDSFPLLFIYGRSMHASFDGKQPLTFTDFSCKIELFF